MDPEYQSSHQDAPAELSCAHRRCWGLLELRARNGERLRSLTRSDKPL